MATFFLRLKIGPGPELENLKAALNLHFFNYNYLRIPPVFEGDTLHGGWSDRSRMGMGGYLSR